MWSLHAVEYIFIYTIYWVRPADRTQYMAMTAAIHFLIYHTTWPLRSTLWCFHSVNYNSWTTAKPLLSHIDVFTIRVIVSVVHELNGICLTSVEKTHVWDYKEWDCVARLRYKYHLLYVCVSTSYKGRYSGALYCLRVLFSKIKYVHKLLTECPWSLQIVMLNIHCL